MRAGLLFAALAFGCSRKPAPVDAEARALSDTVDAPPLPTDSAPVARCAAIRIIVSKDAIHVTNALAFAELDAQKTKALVAAATEDERYGLPLVARNVMRIANGAPIGGGGHGVHGPLGALRPVLEFARDVDKKLLDPDDERRGSVEILADKTTPVGLLFDVAYTAGLAELRPMLRVRDGGGMSCTTLLLSNRAASSDFVPAPRYPSAAVRIEREGAALRGCRVFAKPMCDSLDAMLRTIAGPQDPCEPTSEDASTFTLLEAPDELPLGDLLGAFHDAPLGLRAFTLAAPGSRLVESFRKRECHDLLPSLKLDKLPVP